jgi:hypothetical protein
MDGGRVLRALLTLGLGRLRATEIAAGIGLVFAVLIGLVALLTRNPMSVVLALFVAIAGQQELRMVRWQEGRRAQPRPVPVPVPNGEPLTIRSDAPAPQGLHAGYSGFTWNPDTGLWVQWRDGLPVAFWGRRMGGGRVV